MELHFRQRLDRPDKQGRAAIFADLHWAGGHRCKLPTGVKVLPAHWQPTKTKRIRTAAENSTALNLRLARLLTAVQGVFTTAEGQGRPEASVTVDELRVALREANAGSKRAAAPAPLPPPDPTAPLPDTASWADFYARWQRENTGRLTVATLAGPRQFLPHLAAFDPALTVATLTRERATQYAAWLYAQGYKSGTVARHYVFLRECVLLAGRPAPKWLTLPKVRYGKAIGLTREEVVQLATTPLPPLLDRARNVFLLQLLLLLRDSDLRALRPHHIRPHELPGLGKVLCVELYQQKTTEPVLVPLPPLAVTIWQHYQGRPPVVSTTHRIDTIRAAAQAAGLTREVVKVAFSGKARHETVRPLWEALTTHSARHTGATLLTWASDGDQTLKELALGHVSESVYGGDTVERYGPRLLDAWARALQHDRGQNEKNRGQLVELPPVLAEIGAGLRKPYR